MFIPMDAAEPAPEGEALLLVTLQANRQLQEFKDKGTLAGKNRKKGKQANRELQQFNRTLGMWVGVGGWGGGSKKQENWPGGEKCNSSY